MVFLWRYIRRVQPSQMFASLGLLLVLGGVVNHLSSDEGTSVYTRSAVASRGELSQRFEGGVLETFREVGYMGAGLGTATQGVHHLLGSNSIGWQEGGFGKVAMEVGLPGILALLIMVVIVGRLLLILTYIGDVRGSSQFLRVMLFALVAANIAGFIGSAQAYNDAVTSFTGTVVLTSTATLAAGGGTTASFTAGVLASTSVTISNTGLFTITATKTAAATRTLCRTTCPARTRSSTR